MKDHRRHQEAFTLVELLVVIGIIAVLISILLPALNKARDQARTLAGQSNLRQMGIAIMMYAQNNNDYLPPGNLSYNGDTTNWAYAISPYLGGKGNTGNSVQHPLPKVFQDPNAGVEGGELHYCSNPLIIPDMNRKCGSSATPQGYLRQYKMARARPASDLFALADGVQIGSITMGTSTWNAYPVGWWISQDIVAQDPRTFSREGWFAGHKNTQIAVTTGNNRDAAGGTPPSGDIRYRQKRNKAANLLFIDGHVDLVIRGEDPTPPPVPSSFLGSMLNGNLRPAAYDTLRSNLPF